MTTILTFLTKHKQITSYLGIFITLVTLIGALWSGYTTLKNSWYEQGIRDAELAHQTALIEAKAKYDEELKKSLAAYKESMQASYDAQLKRALAERDIDTKVTEKIEYVTKEIHIPSECNVVPVEFSSMFNEAIQAINSNAAYDKQSRVYYPNKQLFTY